MFSRSIVVLAIGAGLLSACAAGEGTRVETAPVAAEPARLASPVENLTDAGFYAARADGKRMLAAIDLGALSPDLLRQRVPFETAEAPGTVIIETAGPHLYFVEGGGTATRYGVAVGREGFGWTGAGTIARNARWPTWTPPPAMIARTASLAKWAGGMPGGPDNPLGARALYISFGDQDSQYRIHGTNEPLSIGRSASSGCFRMLNQDVIDLFERVPRGAKVIVR